jgi:hypothetical protein
MRYGETQRHGWHNESLAEVLDRIAMRPRYLRALHRYSRDDPDGLDEAAISANQLRRAGTRVFLIQLSEDLTTARRLQYLARVSGGAYFRFDPRSQERQFADMWKAMSAYTTGGEEAVRAKGGQAATLLLEHLDQAPMSTVEMRERVRAAAEPTPLRKR